MIIIPWYNESNFKSYDRHVTRILKKCSYIILWLHFIIKTFKRKLKKKLRTPNPNLRENSVSTLHFPIIARNYDRRGLNFERCIIYIYCKTLTELFLRRIIYIQENNLIKWCRILLDQDCEQTLATTLHSILCSNFKRSCCSLSRLAASYF